MIPSSSWRWSISRLPWRAKSRPASFTRLERSAPVKPGVCAARLSRSMCFASALPRVWPSKIFARPLRAVGAVDHDLAVEAARAQQRGIEDVRAVGGRDEDDVVLHLEAVHLDEQLVERLLALVVTAAQAGAAVAADGVDLVHEDDAG